MLYESRAVRKCFQAFPPWAEDGAPYVDAVGVQVLRQGLAVLEDAPALHTIPVRITAMLVKGFRGATDQPALETDPVSMVVMFT